MAILEAGLQSQHRFRSQRRAIAIRNNKELIEKLGNDKVHLIWRLDRAQSELLSWQEWWSHFGGNYNRIDTSNQNDYKIEEGFFEKDDDHDKSADGKNLKRRGNDHDHEDRVYGKSVKSGMNFKTCEDDDVNEKGVYGKI